MDVPTTFVALLARLADRSGLGHIGAMGGFVLAVVVLFVAAFVFGAFLADLVTQESEAVLAAPFRWRTR